MNKKLSMAALCLAAVCGSASAGVAYPGLERVAQPDGSTVVVRQVGDEFHHFIQTEDGKPLVKGDDGFFYYMTVDVNGRTVSSGVRASSPEAAVYSRTADFGKVYEALNAEGSGMRSAKRRVVPDGKEFLISGFPTTGEIRTLVLLVSFSDQDFKSPTANEDFSDMLNKEGYRLAGACGSARDWFLENSRNVFKPTFDVVGPIKLNQTVEYYGANNASGQDIRARELPGDACDMIANQVDFSQYDYDNDGLIDNVFIFYAGYGEHLGTQFANTIWGHSWEATGNHVYNGKRLSHYACTSELNVDGSMSGMGPFVHEFSHVLGLSDHYSTVYNGAFSPGPWDVMDRGEHNNSGHTPPVFNAFERYQLGWLKPVEIGLEAANLTLNPLHESNEAFIIMTERKNEFFILENRRNDPDTWDAYIPYHGMVIYHVDYDADIWYRNKVNDDVDHQYFDLVEGDNTKSDSSRDTDCYPGRRGRNKEFTDTSVPAMVLWDGRKVGKPITDIKESEDGVITFKMLGGIEGEEPEPEPGEEAAVDGIVVGSDAPAQYYTLQGVRVEAPAKGQIVIKVTGNGTEKILVK